jgi:serine/threonine protein kinase
MDKGSFDEDEARIIFAQILNAVQYLHTNGIVHRDLKPENILFDAKGSNKIKISDFGLAKMFSSKAAMSTLCGTPQYVAPEIVMSSQGRANGKGYSKSVDMWSIGVILYIL